VASFHRPISLTEPFLCSLGGQTVANFFGDSIIIGIAASALSIIPLGMGFD
jgi:hypothetical protein